MLPFISVPPGLSPPRCLAGNFRLLSNHDGPRHAPILEENGVDLILVIACVHQDQKSLRSNLVMQQLDGCFRNPQLPQSIGEVDFRETRLLLIRCCSILPAG
jgi:hypothetical protein